MISYENIDGGGSFRFNLGNRDRIKYFVLSVYDQDGNTIQDMADYFMHNQFIIRKKDETKVLLNKVIEYNRDNNIILGYIFDITIKCIVIFYLSYNKSWEQSVIQIFNSTQSVRFRPKYHIYDITIINQLI